MKNRFDVSPDPDSQADTPTKPKALNPADANGTAEWIETVKAIGQTPYVVVIPYSKELWSNSGFEEAIGLELRKAHLGHFDSAQYGNPIEFYFYLKSKALPDAVELLKKGLQERGLLAVATKILPAEDYVPAPKS